MAKAIRCIGPEKGVWKVTCVNEQCEHNAIMCGNVRCTCWKNHKLCDAIESSSDLIGKALTKAMAPVENKSFRDIKQRIDSLRRSLDDIELRMKLCHLGKN